MGIPTEPARARILQVCLHVPVTNVKETSLTAKPLPGVHHLLNAPKLCVALLLRQHFFQMQAPERMASLLQPACLAVCVYFHCDHRFVVCCSLAECNALDSPFICGQVLSRRLRLSGDFNFHSIAKATPGFVGADLAALTKEAAAIAVTRIFQQLNGTYVAPGTTEPALLPASRYTLV